jgi:hypothetical protein
MKTDDDPTEEKMARFVRIAARLSEPEDGAYRMTPEEAFRLATENGALLLEASLGLLSPPVDHLKASVLIGATARTIDAAVASNREHVSSPFGSRIPDEADAFAARNLLGVVADAIAGFGSWEDVRRAHAALGTRMATQERNAAALARCEETLGSWRKLNRKRRGRAETEEQHTGRIKAVAREEKWLASALTLALREIGLDPLPVAPRLAMIAKRENGSAVTLAAALLGLPENALRMAARKKRKAQS